MVDGRSVYPQFCIYVEGLSSDAHLDSLFTVANWNPRPITQLHNLDDSYLSSHHINGFHNKTAKEARFEELYVLAEVEWLKQQEIVRTAIEERGLQVHAFVYDKEKNICLRLEEVEAKGPETVL